jgi:hypothetical protein
MISLCGCTLTWYKVNIVIKKRRKALMQFDPWKFEIHTYRVYKKKVYCGKYSLN